jgi:hypothetical protein
MTGRCWNKDRQVLELVTARFWNPYYAGVGTHDRQVMELMTGRC